MIVAQEKIQRQEPLEEESRKGSVRSNRKIKRHAKGRRILILVLIVAIMGGIGAKEIQLTVVQGAKVRTLEKEIADLKAQNNELKVQADQLRSVERIEKAALAMGMEKPAGTVYVAGTLPAVKNETGIPPVQVATDQKDNKPSPIKQFSKVFTGFFASTQR